MPFVTVPGLTGKLYVPEQTEGAQKKHPCPDCFSCQQCGDDRCHVCRGDRMSAYPETLLIQRPCRRVAGLNEDETLKPLAIKTDNIPRHPGAGRGPGKTKKINLILDAGLRRHDERTLDSGLRRNDDEG